MIHLICHFIVYSFVELMGIVGDVAAIVTAGNNPRASPYVYIICIAYANIVFQAFQGLSALTVVCEPCHFGLNDHY